MEKKSEETAGVALIQQLLSRLSTCSKYYSSSPQQESYCSSLSTFKKNNNKKKFSLSHVDKEWIKNIIFKKNRRINKVYINRVKKE